MDSLRFVPDGDLARPVAEKSLKVLHVAGLHGNGSTTLANVLGEVDRFFVAGELAYLWQAVGTEPGCACGMPLLECEVWRPALHAMFASPEEAVERLRPDAAWLRARHLPTLALQERHGDPRLARYRRTIGDLIRQLHALTGARVLVETSKHPPYGRLLAGVPGVDAYVVHLVRDPRASAYSWRRVGRWGAARPAVVGAIWTTWHWAIPRLWQTDRYLPLRYEDFVRAPKQALLRILEFVGEPAGRLPFVAGHTVRLGTNHMSTGNPNRYRTGLVTLEPHDEWRARLSRRHATMATVTASPLLHRWRYPVRAGRMHDRSSLGALLPGARHR